MNEFILDENIKNILKHHQLQDLAPNIETMVYREEKQKQKIHGLIKNEFIEAIGDGWIESFLNTNNFASFYLDAYVKVYGLFFQDFLNKYGQEIKDKFFSELKEYEKENKKENVKSEMNTIDKHMYILQDIIDNVDDLSEPHIGMTLSSLMLCETISSFDELWGKYTSEHIASSINYWKIFIFTCFGEESNDTYDVFASRYLYSTIEFRKFLYCLYCYIIS